MRRNRTLLLFLPALLALSPAAAAPADLNRSLERATAKGLYRVKIRSAVDPIPMNNIHSWRVEIADRQGRAVSGAAIAVDGGMPEHRHGLPTAPRAAAANAPGHYVINGVKFSMDGWWELKLAIRGPGGADTVTFNIVL